MLRPSVAFVVQRAGSDVHGGAENLCVELAGRMAAFWNVEILTTCARDHHTWANVYPPGPARIGDVAVRRFTVVRERNGRAFEALSRRLVAEPERADRELERRWLQAQGPEVPALRQHLARAAYDLVYFFSYLYATTYAAIDVVADRAVLLPLAHDEWMLRLPHARDVFTAARAVVALGVDERDLIVTRFPGARVEREPIGSGIEMPDDIRAERFRTAFGIVEPFLLALGRVDAAKGADTLAYDFIALREAAPASRYRKLVFAGPVATKLPRHRDIVVIGAITERMKWDALAASDAVAVASPFESLSLVALEAFAAGRPIVANGASRVLVGHCRRANAGLWYGNREEFVGILASDFVGAREALGRNGPGYIATHFAWRTVVERHRLLAEKVLADRIAQSERP